MTVEAKFKDQLLLTWATSMDIPDGQLGHSSTPALFRRIDIIGPVTDEDDWSRYVSDYHFRSKQAYSFVQRLPAGYQFTNWQTCMWKAPHSFDVPYHVRRLRVALVDLSTEEFY